jgi:excisionase family DNA binding protein
MNKPRPEVHTPRMLTAEEASALLRVRLPQLYALARDGVIPSVRIGRAVRFSSTRLKEWIDAGGAGLREAE